ncbi:MAG: acyl-[acyl-carrier-protein] thioesterase [Dysgonamonadaceae bacterium]|jgi:acyl-ACP thioesterase|nr:acyl-[acyl-carrier-protein] thioesterase [Dysgonamonadaceae bacterium]
MFPKVGSFKFHIESYVCDFTGKATLPVVSNFILQAATIHAHERGFGYNNILKDNVAWVLSRLSIEMSEYPEHDEDLTVETWVENVTRFFTQRCFCFINKNKRIIGYARTIWAAIDIETRRPVDIPVWRPDLQDYIEQEKRCPIEKLAKIPSVNGLESSMGYSVRYSDIDINKHMNSVKYMEHIVNTFDLNIFKEKFIHKFEIVYLAEGTFGDKLKLYKQSVSENEYIIDTKKGEESICRSRIIWK